MKKLFLLLAIAAIVVSCKTDEPTEFKIKDTDMISIKPAASDMSAALKAKSIDEHLSALEIVKQVTEISLYTKSTAYGDVFIKAGRSFSKEQRDTVSAIPKLLMWATDVITLDGQLQTEWLIAKDVVFVKYDSRYISYDQSTWIYCDTIAYIPNSVLRAAEIVIRAAYETKDLEACYTAFNTAYTFTPITGAEWRALKAEGNN